MKDLRLLVWLSQLGLSVALPPLVLIGLAVWLRNSFGWGQWVIWAGIVLGIICAIDGLRITLKAMLQTGSKKQKDNPISFNDHD